MSVRLARVVLNHSTHVDGLIDVLRRVPFASAETIVPGRIKRVAGGPSGGGLSFRVTVPVTGGFRVLAQRGTQLQEVFATTTLTKEALQGALDGALAEKR